MPILKRAIERFLVRPLESHDWIKKVKRAELWEAIDDLRPRPDFDETMFKHQLACFLLGVAYPQFCFWLDMGTGKTRLTLELLRWFYRAGMIKRAIIFITSDKAYPTWAKQIRRFEIGLPYQLLAGKTTEKWRTLEEFDDGLLFISYPGAVYMTSSKEVKKKRKNKKRGVDLKLVKRFVDGVGSFVLDESTRASGNSLTNRLITLMRKEVRIRYALAGRPFGRDPTLLYTQHKLIDGGETLGDTLEMFRAAFMTGSKHPFAKSEHVKKWKFDKSKKDDLARMIRHRSITYAAEECIDLPKWIPIREEVEFPLEAQEYWNAAVESIKKSKGNLQATKNIFLRMRQLSSGFIGFKDDETGAKAQVEFDDNPKFDRLMELLDEMPDDRKAVIFYDFTFSGRKIYEALSDLSRRPIWLWSGTKDYEKDLHNFENKDWCGPAILQNRVGAYSLDGLQVANYSYFYESPVAAIDREQAERRLRRQGQRFKVFQYDLIVKGSADAKVLQYHKEAEGLMKALLRQPERVFK
jgi:hypothetical protein